MADTTRTPEEQIKDLMDLAEQRALDTTELQKQAEALKDVGELALEAAKSDQARILAQGQILEGLKKEKAAIERGIKDRIAAGTLDANQAAEQMRAIEERIIKREQEIEQLEEYTFSLRDSVSAAKDLGKSLGGAFTSKNAVNLKGIASGASKMHTAFKGGGVAMSAFLKVAGPGAGLAIVETFIGEIKALTLEVDAMEKSFRKGTLASKDMARQMTANYKEMIRFGLTAQEAGEAGSALYTGFTDFTMMTTAGQNDIIELTTTMQKLGVSAQTTTKFLQTSTAAFGMSGAQAKRTMLEIEAFAESSRMSFEQLATSYSESASALAKFADPGRTFMDLNRVMKITGMGMNDILRITDKFDTFEGAADQAGKLNAALGGNFVNAMDLMMTTDPVERFDMIRDSILNAGLSFGSMSYYQRKFFAEAAGLESVDQLSMMLRGDTDALAESMEAEAKSMEDLKKIGMDLIPIMEQFAIVFKAIFEDAPIEEIGDMLGFVARHAMKFIGVMKVLMGIVVGVGAALVIGFFAPISAGAAAVWGLIAGVGALAALFWDFGEDVTTKHHSPSTLEATQMLADNFEKMGANINTPTRAMDRAALDRAGAGLAHAGDSGAPKAGLTYDINIVDPDTGEKRRLASIKAVGEHLDIERQSMYT